MKKAIFIVGPTATGKTGLAVKIHKKIPSILVSADSVQVFKGADIVSGKDLDVLFDAKIVLIDEVDPTDDFSINDFKRIAEDAIKKAIAENKIPIVIGGTGYYFDSLFSSIDTLGVKPNKELRNKLENKSIEELTNELEKINPKKFSGLNNSDLNNKRRLIRAIEVSSLGGIKNSNPIFTKDEVLFIGLKMNRQNLVEKIRERVENRIKNGAIEEVKELFRSYKKLSSQLKSSNGYKQLFSHLNNEIDFEEAKERWLIADRQHAKKQVTWFRRNPDINWFDVENIDFENQVFDLIDKSFF
ncbi:MAG TPA: tRNA (adenosine(37)-N6)-dimethylallyltransferase MiaA [Patescibacteria group bacterium]|nr:tRNA (adenosine(37)-N6)-dimethylallyltransferase MiaA [Patescibacteria group bacterium]